MTRIVVWLCLAAGLRAQTAPAAWSSYGHDPQHTGLSTIGAQRLEQIKWSIPIDLVLTGTAGPLYIHYGTPLVTAANTVLMPVRTNSANTYQVEALSGANGTLLYTLPTDYTPPPHNWIPSYSPVLSQGTRLYYPGAGGTVYYRDQPDSAAGPSGQIAFYGSSLYAANQAAFASNVMISTPITADAAGNIYFGFDVVGPNPANLTSGLARIGANGSGSWIGASAAAQGDSTIVEVAMNCAPAISNDGTTVYFGVSEGNSTGGYLVALNSTTLAPIARVRLKDPETGLDAMLLDDSSASPTVGPDGDVYYGVFESSCCTNDDRGWLLHFDKTLTQVKTPGLFGWDTTPSVVPAGLVLSYQGTSTYLLFTKYNNYFGVGPGGNGQNKIAVLDPNGTETDPVTGATVMREVITQLGPTPAPSGGVREWCINSGAVDPFSTSVIANSEDGTVYRWDLATNSFIQKVVLTTGVAEAYTPSAIGADGTAYAINDANLFAVGQAASLTIVSSHTGNFTVGPSGGVYTLVVTNSGSGTTNGIVAVTDTLPAGLTAASIGGGGWTCLQPGGPCNRIDPLLAGGNYPAIALTVNVGPNAASTVTNMATVSSDGAANSVNSTASDVTNISLPSMLSSGQGAAAFSYFPGCSAPPAQAVELSVSGLATGQSGVAFTATPAVVTSPAGCPGPCAWITLSATSGTLTGTATPLTITMTPALLPYFNTPGTTYNGTVTVSTGPSQSNSPLVIPVTVTVSASPALTFSTSAPTATCGPPNACGVTSCTATAAFTLGQTNSAPPSFATVLTLSGSTPDTLTITSNVPWLIPSASATTQAVTPLSITINPALISPLTAGPIVGVVTAKGVTGPESASFTVDLTVANPPTLTATPPSLTFDVPTQSAVQSQTVSLTDSPVQALPVTATPSGGSWLAATGGTTPFTSTVTATSVSLAAGQYAGAVAYGSGNAASAANLPVLLNVGQLTVSGGPVTFTDQLGATTSPATATLFVGAGTAAVNWVSSATGDCAWLTDSASSGVTPRGGSSPLSISYTLAGAAAAGVGTHVCTLSYSAAASYGSTAPAVSTTVTLVVSNIPAFTVTPPGPQTLSVLVGTTAVTTAQFQVAAVAPSTTPPNTVALSVTPSASDPAGVFTTSLSGADTPSTLTVTANPTGLLPNTYTGNFTISSPSIPNSVTVTVFLIVTPGCQFTVTPQTVPLTNAVPADGSTPVTVSGSFTVTPGGACPVTPWTAASNDPWLFITSGGSGNGSVVVTVTFNAWSNPTGGAGVCTGNFFCGPPVPRTGTITITPVTGAPVVAQITQPGSAAPIQYREVTALYQSIFGRDPDPIGYAFWTGPGAPTGVAALSKMADDFLASPEAFNSDFAAIAAYQAATGAPPDYTQFAAAVAGIRAFTQTIPGLFAALIAGNPGYTAATLYQNLLGRAPTATDAGCIGSGLAACFQTIIGFPATTSPVAAANNEFQSTGTFTNLTSAAGDHTNMLYIAMLYYVILDRDFDRGGMQFWLNIANGGGAGLLFQGATGYPTRLQILGPAPPQGFIGGQEFQSLFQ